MGRNPMTSVSTTSSDGLSTVFVALAALFWGLSGGIGGELIAQGWGPFLVAFFRGAMGLIFVAGWLMLQPRRSGLASRQLWFWSSIAGLGVAGNFSFYSISIEQGSVAVAATLMYSAPVFVYVASFLLGLEHATPLKCVAIGVVMSGIVLLTGIYDVDAATITMAGVSAGLLAGLSYAVFIFGFKYAAPHGSPQAILLVAFAVLVVLLLWPARVEQITAVFHSDDRWLFAALGLLGAGVSFIFYIVGLRRTAPAVAAVVAMVEPVTATLFGVVVLTESLDSLQVFGMGLIMVTVTALSVDSGARRTRRRHR